MEPRKFRPAVADGVAMMDPGVAYDPSNPAVGVEVHKTNGLLTQALEAADTLLHRVSGVAGKDANCSPPHGAGILSEACENRELASRLFDRLNELARLLG